MSDEGLQKLQQRVEAVEEENEQLRQTVARFLPDGETRRSFLKLAGVGAAGVVVGGAGTRTVLADADTNDQYGDVGTPSSRVDVFADGVNTRSVTDASSGNTYDVDTLASGGGSVGALEWNPPFNAWEAVGFYGPGPSTDINSWSKNANNPVFQVSSSGWDSTRVQDPSITRVGDTYQMIYTGYDGATDFNLGLATSTDLVNWTRDASNPVLSPGSAGEWDDVNIFEATHIRVGNTYYLIYAADDGSGTFKLGLASSTDLVNWTKNASNPVLSPSADAWEAEGLSHPNLFREGATYHLFYTGKNASDSYQISHATSTDLVNWSRDSNNPVLPVSGSGWDDGETRDPSVIKVGNTYHMLYGGADAASSPQTFQIGHATSTDLSNWTKDSNNPVITTGSAGEFDDEWADVPELFRIGSTYYCLYRGYPGSGDGPREIGLASLDASAPS